MTKQVCWWCCHSTDNEFLHLPFKVNPKTKQLKTMGNFCSWGCMKAYNMSVTTSANVGTVNSLIHLSHKHHTGKIGKIERAPDKYVLNIFGGSYSIEDFRNVSKTGQPIINYPSQLHQIQHILKPDRLTFKDPTSNELNTKMKNITQTNSKGNETLKLTRPTPLKRDLNNLELSMGIKRVSKQS